MPTVRFDRAARLSEPGAGSVKIPKALADEAKEFLKTEKAKEMQLFTIADVVDAAVRQLLHKHAEPLAGHVRDVVPREAIDRTAKVTF